MAIDEHIHRFTTDEYWQMAEIGMFVEKRVELLDGLVVDVSQPSERHVRVIQELMARFSGDYRMLRPQFPFEAADGWVPQPDFAIAAPNPELRRAEHRRAPASALLIAEVSVTSKRRDLRKALVYARADVPVYWLIDVGEAVVLEHTEPQSDGYGVVSALRGTDVLDAGVEGMAPMTVAELLAP